RLQTAYWPKPQRADCHQPPALCGFKLHTGRSRNEQIATNLRLFVRENCASIAGRLADWVRGLTAQAHTAGDAVMPAYTHLQRAEPVLVAHWLQAYGEMVLRG